MVKTASLNAAPKNHVGMGGVNRRAKLRVSVRKVAGSTKTLTFGAAIALALMGQGAEAQFVGLGQPTGNETPVIPTETYSLQGHPRQTTHTNYNTNLQNLRDRGFFADSPGVYFHDPDGDGYGVQIRITSTPRTQTSSDGDVHIVGYNITQTEQFVLQTQGPLVGQITGQNITDNTVTSNDIQNNTITSNDIQDNTVTGTDIADGSVTGTDIADGSITNDDLADGSVDSRTIVDGSVQNIDLAENSVDSRTIVDGSIQNVDLADNSVDSRTIVDGSVQNVDLADNSVDSRTIVDGSVQNVDLADNSVDSRTIENDTILLEDLNTEVKDYFEAGDANTLNQANAYTDNRVNELQQQVNRNADIANDGIAMALAAQVPTLADGKTQAMTFGYGYYSGSSAFALGGTAQIEDTNWQVFGTLGYGFKAEKLGVSMGFLWSR